MLQGLIRGIAPISAASDPFFSSVKLLMGFEGANGSTGAPGMTDESPAAHGTASVTGAAQISTAQAKFGSSSLLLDGSVDGIFHTNHADWNFGAGLFTVECWCRPVTVVGPRALVAVYLPSADLGWVLYQNDNTLRWDVSTTGVNSLSDLVSGAVLSADTQCAACVDYDGIKYRLYADGVMVASSATPRTIFATSTAQLAIGSNSNCTNLFFNGWIDEARITKGVARYASDSGYTPATARFPRS